MKIKGLVNAITRKACKVKLGVVNKSPELLFIAGVATSGAAIYYCVKAAIKTKDILEETEYELDSVEVDSMETLAEVSNKMHVKAGIDICKAFAPVVISEAVSIGCFAGSNIIRKQRLLAAYAAYEALDKSFKFYRNNVIEKYGEDEDRKLRFGVKTEKIEKVITDSKGKEKVVEEEVEVYTDPSEYSDYAKFFDASSREWDPSSDYNYCFLRAKMEMATKRLRAQGYLFLNDVYDMLDIPRTPAGQIVGWIYDEENPEGDNYVDFGIYDVKRKATRDFVNGIENVILLDFNVDGPIVEKLPFYQRR